MGGRLLRLTSKIGGDHRRVVGDILRRTVGNLAAEIEHGDLPADAHHQPHIVIDEQHGEAIGIELLDQVTDTILLGRVHPRRGLIENEQSGLQSQRPRHLQPALVAV